MTKQDAINEVIRIVGGSQVHVSRGSTEPKHLFILVAQWMGLDIDPHLSKPNMGRAITQAAGINWDSSCDSTQSPSGGGSTVTLEGLTRVLRAVEERAPTLVHTQSRLLGSEYRSAPEGERTPPIEITRNWDSLDAATSLHSATQNEIANLLQQMNVVPISPAASDPQFDLAWRRPDLFVCEVKTTTSANRRQQIRLGLGQLVDYRYRLQTPDASVSCVLVITSPPTSEEREICAHVGIRLIALDEFTDFANTD